MKLRQRSQHVHWRASVSSDAGVFECVSVCEGCCTQPRLKEWFMCGSAQPGQEPVCCWHDWEKKTCTHLQTPQINKSSAACL